MKRNRLLIVLLAALFTTGFIQAGDSWLHVKVDSPEGGGEMVRVNIPFSLVETILPMVGEKQLKDGKLHLEGVSEDGLDLRAVLEQFRNSSDADFVKVRDGDENVTLSKKGEFLLVNATDVGEGGKVRIRLPLAIVDALLAGEPDSLDLAAALEGLSRDEGDLVSVEDGEETVRIWVDSRNDID